MPVRLILSRDSALNDELLPFGSDMLRTGVPGSLSLGEGKAIDVAEETGRDPYDAEVVRGAAKEDDGNVEYIGLWPNV